MKLRIIKQKLNRIINLKVKEMKKVLLTMVAVMAFMFSFAGTTGYSIETNTTGFNRVVDSSSRFDLSCDMWRLSALLELDEWQMEAVELIHNTFNEEIQSLALVRGPRLRHLVNQAVRKDAKQMHKVLNDKQFNTYMILLTTSLRNKHL